MRLDPDQRKYIKIFFVIAIFGPLLFFVWEQKCGWIVNDADDPSAVHERKIREAQQKREIREARQERARKERQKKAAEDAKGGEGDAAPTP